MSRYILGIDPGPLTSGLVVYHQPEGAVHGRVVLTNARACLLDIRAQLTTYALQAHKEGAELHVVIERTQAGPPSTAVVRTTEVVGRLMEACEVRALDYTLYYRRQVLQALGGVGVQGAGLLQRAVHVLLPGFCTAVLTQQFAE